MDNDHGGRPDEGSVDSDILPILVPLFVVSGCAALIYEVVWLQLLQLVIGSTAISMGVLLATYMGGMCLGSLAVPRYVSTRHHPLQVYAYLEAAIGVMGLAIVYGVPYVERVYTLGAAFAPSLVLRGVVALVCLLPPTVAMGATLPAIARCVRATPRGVSWLGFLYTGNIAGGVVGCLFAGFYLLRLYNVVKATQVAVVLNFAAAFVAAIVARVTHHVPARASRTSDRPIAPGWSSAWPVHLAIGLSGLAALGAEVVWTRLLSLTLGATVYTFSIILGVFLIGLGLGSGLGSLLARSVKSPALVLGAFQLGLAVAVGWSAYAIAESIPYWPVSPSMVISPWYMFQLDLVRAAWAILPAAIGWGASFPLALAAAARPGQEASRLVAWTYVANTIGAIVGAIAFGVVLIPAIGTQASQRVLIVLSAAGAVAAWASMVPHGESLPSFAGRKSQLALGVAVLGASAIAALAIWSVPRPSCGAVAFGRRSGEFMAQLAPGMFEEKNVPLGQGPYDSYCTFVGEGMNVSVAITKTKAGIRSFHGAGKVQASNSPQDMRFQRMLGHVTSLAFKKHAPESVLVVALGAGVTAGSFVPYDTVKRIVICDIEPMVPKHVAPLFAKENYSVTEDPRTQIYLDDGRHFVRTTKEKFDIITSDPIDPWVKGCASLNTEEYYRMCRERLNPGGIMALWMPFYESNPETTKSLIATFFKVFPHGILWSNDFRGKGFDAVLFGSVDPIQFDLDELERWLDEHPKIRSSLEEVGFGVRYDDRSAPELAIDLLATYAGRASDMSRWLEGAQINTDRNLRLQYLAGMGLNSNRSHEIFRDILEHYRYPNDLFVGSETRKAALKQALEENERRAENEPKAAN